METQELNSKEKSAIADEAESNSIPEQILLALENAWNQADGESYGAQFTEDADFVDIRGDLHKSKFIIGAGHQAILDTMYKNSRSIFRLIQCRKIGTQCMLVHARQILHAPSGPLMGDNETTLSLVIVKQYEEWKIISCQNTLVAVHEINWKERLQKNI